MSKIEAFLTPTEEAQIIEAIRLAEQNTSGEIRVHMEANSSPTNSKTKIDVLDRAAQVFDILHMGNTKLSNGVLIYVAVEDRELVIMGDKGINDLVAPDFWESTKNAIISKFQHAEMANGLVDGILKAGQQLKNHFPYEEGDANELSDEISIG
ncbi:MAG: putative membrane protein [Sediminicola sp.]|jgi:uncharacterized membrane protein|tara:strand:+ start:4899 stop:5357 length:459 start_codon:yes stop_codon:yes gene_type:complete